MLSLGALAFAAPWALGAVTFLPALWWLLRVTPPAPRTVRFPAVRLLFGLEAREDTAARTPPWVLLLRLLLALLVILAVAHPLINPSRSAVRAGSPVVLAIDDGWASARDWRDRIAFMDEALAQAERAGSPVIVLPTAPPADGSPVAASGLMAAAEARAIVQALEPKPWPPDRAAAAEAISRLPRDRSMRVLWLADGLDYGKGTEFARALQTLGGGLEIVVGRGGRVLLPPADDSAGDRMTVAVRRLASQDGTERVAVRALDGSGRVLGREEATFGSGQAEATVALRMPSEIRNRLTRLDVEGEASAAAVVLLDERWRRRPVGVAGGAPGGAPLLNQLYYVEKALAPFAEIHAGEVSELLARELAVMILADVPAILGTTGERLSAWVEGGGVLVRFAGPALAHAATQPGEDDPLLPVRLRDGGRSLGGAMSWTSPQRLAPLPAAGPLAGLAVPADVTVQAQVLAEPTLDLADRTWARLEDGTPLVTAARKGKGWVVLFHTSANAEWSNLALSGLFPDMLRRMVALASGLAAAPGGMLAPIEVMDGFGRLQRPSGAVAAIDGKLDAVRPGPRQPPGFYGDAGSRVAFNLGPAVGQPAKLATPTGASITRLSDHVREVDLRPPLLLAALALAIVDLAASLVLRGLIRPAATGMAVLLAGLAVNSAHSADSFAMQATLTTRLAYVRTGDGAVDRKSEAGLAALSRLIGERSTATLSDPVGVDVEKDPVLFFPLVYWPVTAAQKPPSPQAVEKFNAYMRHGGLIVFDTAGDGQPGTVGAERVGRLVEGLAIPPLSPVTEEHVLTRSFYLLKELPGRFDNGPVWVEAGIGSDNDGVSPVVVGGNDWAGAWAADQGGRPLYATVPGGERQRELAYRFGMNLVMYALTGNYKADQVHLPAILERLGR